MITENLDAIATHFQGEMTGEAWDYLYGRGISRATANRFRLGYVPATLPEWRDNWNMLSLPYVTKLGGVVGFKFRRPHQCEGCEHSKYLTPYPSRLYNTLAFERAEKLGYIGIAEGEVDAMILDGECDIPAVGIPGVETWIQHKEWRPLFDGFEKVYVFSDNDDEGLKLEKRILHDIDIAVPVRLPAKDVNETFIKFGREEIRNAAGME